MVPPPWTSIGLQCGGKRLHAKFAIQLSREIGIPILQNQGDIADRGYILRRVAVDEYQIGTLASLDRSPIGEYARIGCAVPRRDPQHFVRRHPCFDVQLQFPLKRESGAIAAPRPEWYPATVRSHDPADNLGS